MSGRLSGSEESAALTTFLQSIYAIFMGAALPLEFGPRTQSVAGHLEMGTVAKVRQCAFQYTTSSRQMAYRCADFGHEVGRRLVKAFNNLNPIFSAVIAEQATARESQSREAQRYENVYEARKRELLISLRQKVSEMRAKRQSD